MKRVFKVFVYMLAFVMLPLSAGILALISAIDLKQTQATMPLLAAGTNLAAAPASYDPSKPIVAILLGDDVTEVSDFLGPYELFSASKAYNVYTLAPQHRLTTLTGELEVLPDMSLAEFDQQFGRDPDLIVAPNIPLIKNANNQPLVSWIKKHAGPDTVLFSWCVGAAVLAETGLLDGKTATTHWGDIDRLEMIYPNVHWTRGLRYVDESNNIVTSGGLLSGIDATLHVISKLKGPEFTRALAESLHYQNYQFVENPQLQQYKSEPNDLIMILNAAYKWEKNEYGLLLYDGVGELELASLLDTYSASYTTNLHTIALSRQIITTKNGLHLFPRWNLENAPRVERLLIPGANARQTAPAKAIDWANTHSIPTAFLHAEVPTRFAFERPLEDLAIQQNNSTAEFAKKRLEYRADNTRFEGATWPVLVMLRPVLLGLVGLGLARLIGGLFSKWQKRRRKDDFNLQKAIDPEPDPARIG